MAFLAGSTPATVVDDSSQIIVGSGTSNPTSPTTGTIFFNTSTGILVGWNGSSWVNLTVA